MNKTDFIKAHKLVCKSKKNNRGKGHCSRSHWKNYKKGYFTLTQLMTKT